MKPSKVLFKVYLVFFFFFFSATALENYKFPISKVSCSFIYTFSVNFLLVPNHQTQKINENGSSKNSITRRRENFDRAIVPNAKYIAYCLYRTRSHRKKGIHLVDYFFLTKDEYKTEHKTIFDNFNTSRLFT